MRRLPDGQPILNARHENRFLRYTFCENGLWYTYPEYKLVTDTVLITRLTENTEEIFKRINANKITTKHF